MVAPSPPRTRKNPPPLAVSEGSWPSQAQLQGGAVRDQNRLGFSLVVALRAIPTHLRLQSTE
eukprot:7318602-Alexandrium_andersonii.AAC.1